MRAFILLAAAIVAAGSAACPPPVPLKESPFSSDATGFDVPEDTSIEPAEGQVLFRIRNTGNASIWLAQPQVVHLQLQSDSGLTMSISSHPGCFLVCADELKPACAGCDVAPFELGSGEVFEYVWPGASYLFVMGSRNPDEYWYPCQIEGFASDAHYLVNVDWGASPAEVAGPSNTCTNSVFSSWLSGQPDAEFAYPATTPVEVDLP